MFKNVIWATDGSEAADEALAVASQMAGEAGGKILALHVVELTMPEKAGGRLPVYASEDELQSKIESQLSELTSGVCPPGCGSRERAWARPLTWSRKQPERRAPR
jgi:nucleotide-binding universal stress UspA family protein